MEFLKKYWIVVLSISFSGCAFLLNSNMPLSLMRTDNNGMELKVQGYYLGKIESCEKLNTSYVLLYQNGVCYKLGTGPYDKVKFESVLLKWGLSRDSKTYWGVYQIEKDSIELEIWGESSGGLGTINYKGPILNDTTFVFTDVILNGFTRVRNEHESILDTFNFYKFSPKPDSTNTFIK